MKRLCGVQLGCTSRRSSEIGETTGLAGLLGLAWADSYSICNYSFTFNMFIQLWHSIPFNKFIHTVITTVFRVISMNNLQYYIYIYIERERERERERDRCIYMYIYIYVYIYIHMLCHTLDAIIVHYLIH